MNLELNQCSPLEAKAQKGNEFKAVAETDHQSPDSWLSAVFNARAQNENTLYLTISSLLQGSKSLFLTFRRRFASQNFFTEPCLHPMIA